MFSKLFEVAEPRGPQLCLVDFPLCASEALPARARGWMEGALFTAFERAGAAAQHPGPQGAGEPHEAGESCAACRHDAACLGWRGYLDVHGRGGLEPFNAWAAVPPLSGGQ